jgi:hypothetical protein
MGSTQLSNLFDNLILECSQINSTSFFPDTDLHEEIRLSSPLTIASLIPSLGFSASSRHVDFP